MFERYTIPVCLLTAAAIGVIILLKRNGRKNLGKPYPPCLPTLPLVGSLPFIRVGMEVLPNFFMKTAEKLGPVFSFYAGSKMVVVLNGKKAIADAMLKHGESFADRPDFWSEAKLINTGLRGIPFAHYTDFFKVYRKQSLSIMKEFGFGSAKVTEERILHQVEDLFEEIRNLNGSSFNPKTAVTHAIARVILGVLFGQRFETSGSGNWHIIENASQYVENIDPMIDMAPLVRFLPKYRKKIATLLKCWKEMINGLEEGIEYNKAQDSEQTYVKRYLEMQGDDYDHQNLLYTLRDFVQAGTETTTSTLLWAFVELANHPQVQSRIYTEIQEAIPDDRLPFLDDKTRLPYTEAVVLELLRRHTLLPLSVPHATTRNTETCGYSLPQGCMVIINIYSVHMDRETWTDPENFRPERFLDNDNKVTGMEKIIPFGQGKRSCIGEFLARQELFLFLTSFVQQFNILPPEGQESVVVHDVCGITVHPSLFEVRFIPRRKF